MIEKIAVFAPIPRASESTATAEVPGARRTPRIAHRRSASRLSSNIRILVVDLTVSRRRRLARVLQASAVGIEDAETTEAALRQGILRARLQNAQAVADTASEVDGRGLREVPRGTA